MSSYAVLSSETTEVTTDQASTMGIGSSKPAKRGILLTLDALGTLYRFRAPVAEQYLSVAQRCGLKSTVDLSALEASFKESFKTLNSEAPNYGKGLMDLEWMRHSLKGTEPDRKYKNPEAWWSDLVERTFRNLLKGEKLPEGLGSAAYQHFSTGTAYELYPDVRPFLKAMHELRNDSRSPTVMLGIITNSDPRVKSILQSMNLRLGKSQNSMRSRLLEESRQIGEEHRRTGNPRIPSPWADLWNTSNDFDFVTTSYDANDEKPNLGIWTIAYEQAREMALSLATQGQDAPSGLRAAYTQLMRHNKDIDSFTWIHVGDDYDKDCVDERTVPTSPQCLLLVRDGEGKPVEGANMVTSLTEVASIVNLTLGELSR